MRVWRKIESSIITSDRLSRVSDSAKWLFTLLLVAQDDEGKYPWTKPRRQALIATTLWDIETTDALLSELSQSGIVALKEGYIHLKNGASKNGTPANSSKYPVVYPPIADVGTESCTQEYSEVRVEKNKSREEEIKEPPIVPQRGTLTPEQQEWFDSFWEAYPVKKDKTQAIKAWKKLKVNPALWEVILDGLRRYKQTDQWTKDDGAFIPHPSTWLHRRRWEDDITERSNNGTFRQDAQARGGAQQPTTHPRPTEPTKPTFYHPPPEQPTGPGRQATP